MRSKICSKPPSGATSRATSAETSDCPIDGINAQIRSANGTGSNDSGIGFAIPIDAAKHSVAQLIAKGKVTYAYVGISTEDLTPSLARALGYKAEHGALIVGVAPPA